MSDSLQPHELHHARQHPCPSLSPRVSSNSRPLSPWCHPTPSSVTPFSPCPQSFPASGSFSSELALRIRWPKYWSFSFSISPSNEYSGLISFRIIISYLSLNLPLLQQLKTVAGLTHARKQSLSPHKLTCFHQKGCSSWCEAWFAELLLEPGDLRFQPLLQGFPRNWSSSENFWARDLLTKYSRKTKVEVRETEERRRGSQANCSLQSPQRQSQPDPPGELPRGPHTSELYPLQERETGLSCSLSPWFCG